MRAMASANSGSGQASSLSSSLTPWRAIFYLLDCLTCRAASAVPPPAASARSRSLLFLFRPTPPPPTTSTIAAASAGPAAEHFSMAAAAAECARVWERERAESEALDQSTAISVMEENGVKKTGDRFDVLTESSA